MNLNIDIDMKNIIRKCYEAEMSKDRKIDCGYCCEKVRKQMRDLYKRGLILIEENTTSKSSNHYNILGFTIAGRQEFLKDNMIKDIYRV